MIPTYAGVLSAIGAGVPTTWTQQTSGFDAANANSGVASNGTSYFCSGQPDSGSSPDGVAWTIRSPAIDLPQKVAFGNGKWVVVGANTGPAAALATSTDSVSWTAGTAAGGTVLLTVAYGSSLWVYAGLSGVLATASDPASTWTARTSSFGADNIYSVAYNGTNLWVATGGAGKIASSPDAITWTQRTVLFTGSPLVRGVAFGGGVWVAVADNGELATSPDGVTWTLRTSSFGATGIYCVAYSNGAWVIGGASGKLATATSPTVLWTQQTPGFGSDRINAVTYGSVWVAVGNSGKIATA